MAEVLGHCECCNAAIREGDTCHYSADGCWMCEEHAPSLSDAIRQHQQIIDAEHFDPGDLAYDSRDEMAHSLLLMKKDYQEHGDRKLLVTA
ncbi:hypothetical protein [Paracoccus aerius]|uniref:Uncharacterized protein n=1 Tax=Paracoccus aerius TaxID=1915382 RepID=A0ABS1S6B1_9RHOB|nr:hypothetical protein [Paracoccus aerius]MBL3674267.1 hypothetical protein [Paracoccus aerius]GHG24476.1 hypothetical protein GCM10017322_23060 [Paracoccus aerius]